MNAVILASGLGMRVSGASQVKAPSMDEIGGKPILWHPVEVLCGKNHLEPLWQSGVAPWKQ